MAAKGSGSPSFLDFLIIVAIILVVSAIAIPNLMHAPEHQQGHHVYSVRGTVCNVWVHQGGYTDVTFQHDSGQMELFKISQLPPVWAGMHVEMKIDHTDYSYWTEIEMVKRLD